MCKIEFVCYILKCADNGYYTGITNSLIRRFAEHNNGKTISTRFRLPVLVEHTEFFRTRGQARAKEVRIKRVGAKRYLLGLRFR